MKTVAPPARFIDYAAKVSMRQTGTGSTPRVFDRMSRYQLLPANDGGFGTFLGIRTDKQTAVFMFAKGVEVTGQGRCAPSAAECLFLTLQPGQSAKLDVPTQAGSKTFLLRFAGIAAVTSSASVVAVDPDGRMLVRRASKSYAMLKQISYGRYTSLLRIGLGSTIPVPPSQL